MGEMTLFDEEAESFKGSLAMADILDRHVAETATAVRQRCPQASHRRSRAGLDTLPGQGSSSGHW